MPRRPTRASALRGVPLVGVGVGGSAGDSLEFDGLDDRLCDRIWVYPQFPQPLPLPLPLPKSFVFLLGIVGSLGFSSSPLHQCKVNFTRPRFFLPADACRGYRSSA
jgi:hypothetical protein